MSCEFFWIFVTSLCLTHVYAKSLNHVHFDMAPINFQKSLSSLTTSMDPIDEEENFWINSQQEQRHDSLKLGPVKNHEEGSNLVENLNKQLSTNSQMSYETFPKWVGLPKSTSKNGPKTSGKITDGSKKIGSKHFEARPKIKDQQEKITIFTLPLLDNKSSSSIKIQQLSSSEKNVNFEKNPEKMSNTEKRAENKDLDLSDLLILDELSEKLNDKSVQPLQDFLAPPKNLKLFSPIYTSFDILKSPFTKGGLSTNKQKHGPIQNLEVNGKKDRISEFEKNGIKVKENFGLDNPSLNLKKTPIRFSQPLGKSFKLDNSLDVPSLQSFKYSPEPSLTMTSIFVSPAKTHLEDMGSFDSLKLRGEDDSKTIKMNFRAVAKPLLKKENIFGRKMETSNSLKQIQTQEPNPPKLNMMIDILDENPSSKVDEEKTEISHKEESKKLSKDAKNCHQETDTNYPAFYQFLEKISDKILDFGIKYETAIKLGQDNRIKSTKENNVFN